MVASPEETPESHDVRDNYNFVQISRSYLTQMRKLARASPIAHEILYYLVEHMGRTTNAVVCSYGTLCEVTGVSRPTVGRAIKLLKDENWIDTVKIGNASAYCVNERVFWQAGRNQRKYAVFSATVIASASEQDSNFKEKAKQKLTYIPIIEDNNIAVTGKDELPPPDQQDLDI
ncbi:plasmid replication initiation protein [Pseudomonas sp. FSL R10-1350]|uniref:Plasmid replication initiation protein n=3 Tax=Pseudomonas TaxID=286 RepID=A0A6A7ZI61_9PSED|nr:plasmid replication initiation protein [Escherichia coli]MQT71291.1 plasmid replication initiation protein [Pseudomonas sp. FSL R10-0071]MQT87501.1 plasmid replication initiation protein [Pseudomonas sp. FSL R10-2964]MQT98524.1 plasmid replication initiation protein [Pseudomonas helleri]MQU66466.1 plasmid replication initiation protein [Pseudomonas sp. FSL R10-1350]